MKMKVLNIRKFNECPEHNLRYTFDLEFENGFKVLGWRVFKVRNTDLMDVRGPIVNIRGQDGKLYHKNITFTPAEMQSQIEGLFFKELGGLKDDGNITNNQKSKED